MTTSTDRPINRKPIIKRIQSIIIEAFFPQHPTSGPTKRMGKYWPIMLNEAVKINEIKIGDMIAHFIFHQNNIPFFIFCILTKPRWLIWINSEVKWITVIVIGDYVGACDCFIFWCFVEWFIFIKFEESKVAGFCLDGCISFAIEWYLLWFL